MSTKSVFSCALWLVLLGVGAARAQEYLGNPNVDAPAAQGGGDLSNPPAPIAYPPHTGPSEWTTYRNNCCCGPIGGDGPIRMELYARTGPDVPIGNAGFIAHSITTGWIFEGGGRSLFFNTARDGAFTVDLGASYSYNNAHGNNPLAASVASSFLRAGSGTSSGDIVQVSQFQRTFATGALGYEWFLGGPIGSDHLNWRAGFDLGGMYGVSRVDLHDITNPNYARKGHTAGGFKTSLHADFEYPCDYCTYIFGLRAEWDFTDTQALPGVDNQVYDLNFLVNFGVRF